MHITEFQEMMKTLYLRQDSERGIKGTYEWLKDEVEELGEALQGTDKGATEKEFADVIAWLSSLANLVNVNLEKAAINKYPNKCPIERVLRAKRTNTFAPIIPSAYTFQSPGRQAFRLGSALPPRRRLGFDESPLASPKRQ